MNTRTIMSDPLIDLVVERGEPEHVAAMRMLAQTLLDDASMDHGQLDLPGVPSMPTSGERSLAAARNTDRWWRVRREVYEDALPYEVAAEQLRVSKQQISNLVSAGDLVALHGSEGKRLPVWQFNPDTSRGRLEGIRKVVAVYPGGVLSLSTWAVASNQALGNRTPAEALADGEIEHVVVVATAGL